MTISVKCKSCGNTFSYIPFSKIKKKLCQACEKAKSQEQSKKRNEENKKMLSRASFFDRTAKKTKVVATDTRPSKKIVLSRISDKTKFQRKADKYFSWYIRLKHAFESGGEYFCRCYTCGHIHPIKEIQNGHWQRRGHINTRYAENNCRPQCVKCNYHRSGEPEKFEIYLIDEIGQQEVDKLKKLSQQIGADCTQHYRNVANLYQSKYKQLLTVMGIKTPFSTQNTVNK